MSNVIFGLIGLALAMTNFACKQSKHPVAEVRPASAPHSVPKAPEWTLESGLATEWTELKVAFGWHEECAGFAVGDQLLITRKNNRMMIRGREMISFGKFREIPERTLDNDEFDEILKELRLYYGFARSETAEAKPFDSFPPGKRETELAAYYEMLGRPYLGSNSGYFYVQFDPNTPEMTIRESFTDPRSVQGYKNWLQKTLKGRDSVP